MRKDIFDKFAADVDTCPFCGEYGVYSGSFDFDTIDAVPHVMQESNCHHCGRRWVARYRIDSADELERGAWPASEDDDEDEDRPNPITADPTTWGYTDLEGRFREQPGAGDG